MKKSLLTCLGISMLMSSLGGQALAAEPMTTVRGVVSYPSFLAGVYEWDLSTYDPKLIKLGVFASGGGINYNDGYSMEYYGVRFEVMMGIPAIQQTSYYMDKDWEQDSQYSGSMKSVATDLAYSYGRNAVYGCFMNDDGTGYNFASYNPVYFSPTVIAPLEKEWSACDFGSDGKLYAIDCDGDVWTVNLNTAELTAVGSTGVKSEWITGGFIDQANNTFYWAVKTEAEAALYKITLPSCTPTKVYKLENEEQLGGFIWNEPVVDPKAPAANVSSLSPSFSGTSLSGRMRITPPSTTVDGTKGEGKIKYHILANGIDVATGDTDFAAAGFYVDFTLPEADTYCLGVAYSNEAGMGPRKITTSNKWYGPDVPKATTRLTPTYNDGKVTLSWYAVSSGVHGGSLDTSSRKYRLTRYANGEATVLSDELTTTSYIDELPETKVRTTYYYTLECIAGGLTGEPFKSAEFALGPITPPFNMTFTSAISIADWTAVKGENETKAWAFQSTSNGIGVSTSTKPSDSWIFTPVLKLQAGKSYGFSMKARSYSDSYTETFEVKAGRDTTALSMTMAVIDTTTVKGSTFQEFVGTIEPEADGDYYLGIHAITPVAGYYLYVSEISIADGLSAAGPAAVADLKMTADATGAHKATATFTVPSLTMEGGPLTGITAFELLRDGEVVATETAEYAAGAEVSVTDDAEDLTCGTHAYQVICYNGSLKGALSEAVNVYVGYSKPTPVTDIKVTEDPDQPGKVTVSWTAPEADVAGVPFSEGALKYYVWNRDEDLVASEITETSVTLEAVEAGKQIFARYIVIAVSEGGQSDETTSGNTPVGTPYATPWKESFAGKQLTSIFGSYALSGSDLWTLISADTDWGIYPQDEDGGLAFLEGYSNTKSSLYSGKIDLGELTQPALTFYVYNFGGSGGTISTNTIDVQVRGLDGQLNTVQTVVVGETGELNQWNKVIVPLDDYAGQIIRYQIVATVKDMRFFYVDNMQITNVCDNDLSIIDFSAPASVDPGKEFNAVVTVTNNGTEAARGYRVVLYDNEEEIGRVSGPELKADASTEVSFALTYTLFDEISHKLTAEVEYTIDGNPADNVSETVTVEVFDLNLPKARNLSAEVTNGDVKLAWEEPNMGEAPVAPVTEDFEKATAWTSQVEGWTFLDLDKATIGGIGSSQLPINGRQSFFIFDNTDKSLEMVKDITTRFAARSGKHQLVAMYSNVGNTPVQLDDWAISPELSGNAQTISFYASSLNVDNYLESFEILYSTTGVKPEDFTLIKRYNDVPAAWIKYEAYLPAGTKHFAIRCISYDKYMFRVDDVTYTPAKGSALALNHQGYNVWRDGVKLNDTPVTTAEYTDAAPAVNDSPKYTYHVTALYDQGESRLSEPAYVDMSLLGIDAVEAGYDPEATYYNLQGIMIQKPSKGNIYIVRRASGTTKELLR